MVQMKDTKFYPWVLKEFNYPFGDVFVFKKFIVSEINEGVNFDYDKAEVVIKDICGFLGVKNGDKINYISNRVNSYSVTASDWIKFFKNSYLLKSYIVVSSKRRFANAIVEKLFFKDSIKHFKDLEVAISFIENNMVEN